MLSKAMITQKTKPMSRVYAVKSDDNSKPKTNILAYAVKSDDGETKNNTLKPGKLLW